MKKLLFSALALTLVFALASWATDTRVLTLGEANQIVKDEANIFLYPSTLNLYRGLALAEVNPSYGLQRLGIHYDFGEGKGIVGLYLDKKPQDLIPGQINAAGTGVNVDNRLVLFYARPFGEIDFGMALSLYHDSYKVDSDTANKTEQANTDIGLDFGVTLMDKLDLAASIDLVSWTRKNADGFDVTKPKSNMAIGLGGRYWHEFTDEVNFVPHLAFKYTSGGFDTSNATGTNLGKSTMKEMEIDAGWGVNIRPEERILVLFDIGVNYDATTEKWEPATGTSAELKYKHMYLPYFKAGIEGHVTNWWDLRLGAVKRWWGQSDEDVSTTSPPYIYSDKYGKTETVTYLGSGIHFGNLNLDVELDPDFVLNGPYFITGAQTSPPSQMAYRASIKYTWK